MAPTPADRRNRRPDAPRERRDGDPIAALVDTTITNYREMWDEREELVTRVEQLEREVAEYRELKARLSDALAAAERAAASVRAETGERREAILEQARRRAQEIVRSAETARDELRSEVERLQEIENEAHAGARAILVAALEHLEQGDEHGGDSGPRDSS